MGPALTLLSWLWSVSSLPLAAGAPADESPVIIIDDDKASRLHDGDAPNILHEPATVASPPLLQIELISRLLLNTHLNDLGVEAIQMWHTLRLRGELALPSGMKSVAEAWLRWGVLGKWPIGQPFWLVNARDSQWVGEATLREVYMSWHWGPIRAAVGERLYVWGKNEFGAPADVLNPIDLRYDPTLIFVAPRALRLPVPAIDLASRLFAVNVQVVIIPWFVGQRFFWWGHDDALLSRSAPYASLLNTVFNAIDAPVRDNLQQSFSGTSLPSAAPNGAAAALRASWEWASWDMAATTYYGWDPTPMLHIAPALRPLLTQGSAALSGVNPADTLLSLRGLAQNPNLFAMTYARMFVAAIEGEAAVGNVVVRFDAGYSPTRVYLTSLLNTLQAPTGKVVLGAEYNGGPTYGVTLSTMATGVWAPGRDGPLFGLEAQGPHPLPPLAVSWAVLVGGRYVWDILPLEARAAAVYEIWPGDTLLWASLGYSPYDSHHFSMGLFWLNGRDGTLAAQYAANTFVFGQYQGSW